MSAEFEQYLSVSARKGQPIQRGLTKPSRPYGPRQRNSIWDRGAIHVERDPETGNSMFNRAKSFEYQREMEFLLSGFADILIF